MKDIAPSGTHRIGFRVASGQDREALLSVKFATMVVRPPIGKQKLCAHPTLQIRLNRATQWGQTTPPCPEGPIVLTIPSGVAASCNSAIFTRRSARRVEASSIAAP